MKRATPSANSASPSAKACSALTACWASYAKDTSAAAGVSWLSAGLQGLRWTVISLSWGLELSDLLYG